MVLVPDDINELFDAAIDGKFKDRPVPLAISAWQVTNFPGTPPTFTDGLLAAFVSTVLECPIVLPVGATITGISIGYNRGGGGAVTLSLWRRPLNDGNVSPAAMKNRAISDATGSAWENPTYTDLNLDSVDDLGVAGALPAGETILAGFTYWWRIALSSTATFGGAIMTARKS
jgi:hypothetical protein